MDSCCIGSSCLEHTNFEALVDSGTSFTFLPGQVYDRVAKEVNFSPSAFDLSFKIYQIVLIIPSLVVVQWTSKCVEIRF